MTDENKTPPQETDDANTPTEASEGAALDANSPANTENESIDSASGPAGETELDDTNPDPDIQLFDFKRPSGVAGETVEKMTTWFNAGFNLFQEKWSQIASTEGGLAFKSDMVMTFGNAKSQIPKPGIAFQVDVASNAFPTYIVLSTEQALLIALDMLGDDSQPDEPRPLSNVEFSLCEMFVQELIESMSVSWFEQDSLPFVLREIDHSPHQSKLWPAKTIMLSFTLEFAAVSGACQLDWLVPQKDLEGLLELEESKSHSSETDSQPALVRKAEDVSVEVSVNLGRTQVAVTDLANLSVGDIVVLKNKINEPLEIAVEKKVKFVGWPGRVGGQQAVKIGSVA